MEFGSPVLGKLEVTTFDFKADDIVDLTAFSTVLATFFYCIGNSTYSIDNPLWPVASSVNPINGIVKTIRK